MVSIGIAETWGVTYPYHIYCASFFLFIASYADCQHQGTVQEKRGLGLAKIAQEGLSSGSGSFCCKLLEYLQGKPGKPNMNDASLNADDTATLSLKPGWAPHPMIPNPPGILHLYSPYLQGDPLRFLVKSTHNMKTQLINEKTQSMFHIYVQDYIRLSSQDCL